MTLNYINLNILFLGLGMAEVIIICAVLIILFGAGKVSELMKGIGKGVKSVKDEINEFEVDLDLNAQKQPPREDTTQEGEKKADKKVDKQNHPLKDKKKTKD